jgi:Bifunctional DNA primase/polymerase, N-terminal
LIILKNVGQRSSGLATGYCPQLGSPGHTPLHASCSCTAGTACRNLGKHPRTPHGLKDATTDAAILGQWWAKWPDANIGLVTGSSSGLVVLDVDPRHGVNLTLEDIEAEHQKLPETVESLSGGGGRHLFFQHPGVPNRNDAGTKLGPGLDIRGDGGYVILPPSLHASGRRYEWEVSSPPDDISVRTTLYTKSTAADLAVELLRRAGLDMLLADDDATPQAFIRAMTAHVPEHGDDFSAEAKVALCQQLAFAAQRGWFYEEFGQHLAAMMQRDGVMAAFRSILGRFDDHKETYIYHTIGRARERIDKPYVTLLANLTPADLRPFATKHSALWRDGYLARFGFIVPPEGTRSDAEFPREAITYPRRLIDPLRQWHRRLGIPQADLDPILDRRHKPTGRYRISIDPLPETTYTLSPAV